MTERIRIPFLHPKGIYPPGLVFVPEHPGWQVDQEPATPRVVSPVAWRDDDGTERVGPTWRWVSDVDATQLDEAHVPDDLTSTEAMAVLRALAERYPEHVVVAADEVRQRTAESQLQAWRHPDDVEAIERAWVAAYFHADAAEASGVLSSRLSTQRSAELLAPLFEGQ
jgi:hypothetical protein